MTVKSYRYEVPNDGPMRCGWAILFLDDAGCFLTISDYGQYGHRWPVAGLAAGEDIRRFVLNCDRSYLLGKIAGEVLDGAGTERSIRDDILGQRRCGTLTKEQARKEWDRVPDLRSSEHDGIVAFTDWLYATKLGSDAYEHWTMTTDPRAVAWHEHAWPRLKALIEEELKWEAVAVAAKAVLAKEVSTT